MCVASAEKSGWSAVCWFRIIGSVILRRRGPGLLDRDVDAAELRGVPSDKAVGAVALDDVGAPAMEEIDPVPPLACRFVREDDEEWLCRGWLR